MLTGIKSENVGNVWATVAPMLQRTLDRYAEEYDLETIRSHIEARNMQLWVSYDDASGVIDGVGVTKVDKHPNALICTVMFISGVYQTLENMYGIEQWARKVGCTRIECWCRPAISRYLQENHGFYEPLRIARKDLTSNGEGTPDRPNRSH